MSTGLTLSLNSGPRQTLDTWGFEDLQRTALANAPGTLTFKDKTRSITDSPQLAYDDVVQVFTGSTLTTTGGVTTGTGGTLIFQGRCRVPADHGTGQSEYQSFEIMDAWFEFSDRFYTQDWQQLTAPSTVEVKPKSRVILFCDQTGAAITIAQQISAIVTAAMADGAAIALGTVDGDQRVPFCEKQDITMLAALQWCFQQVPDGVAWFDYSSGTPTLNFRQRANLTSQSVALTDLDGAEPAARYDLQIRGVTLYYETTGTYNGQQYESITTDVAGATTGRRLLIGTVSLKGAGGNQTYEKITTQDRPDDTDIVKFIADRTPWLKDALQGSPLYPTGSPTGNIKITAAPDVNDFWYAIGDDLAGDGLTATAADTLCTQVLKQGQLASWMVEDAHAVVWREVDFNADISYNVTAADLSDYCTKVRVTIACKALVTNACKLRTADANGNRSHTYTSITNTSTGDPVPTGFAAYLYAATSALHYAGQFTTQAPAVAAGVALGQTLNITGGRSAWASMNALITQVVNDWSKGTVDAGRATITLGPPPHLTLADLMDRVRNTRLIQTANVAQRKTGQDQNPAQAILPSGSPIENTSQGPDGRSFFVVYDPAAVAHKITLDAVNQVVKIEGDSGGRAKMDLANQLISITDGTNTISAKLSDINGGGSAKFQETCLAVVTAGPDSNGCYTIAPLHCWVLRSDAIGSCP